MSKQSKQLKLVVRRGIITAIHDDALTAMFPFGDVDIRRASHVEPDGSKWVADLRPVRGPILRAFKTRGEALNAELRYLKDYVVV